MHPVQQYSDIEDEHHKILVCEYFRGISVKYMYIKPFYCKRAIMLKFFKQVNSTRKKDRFKQMLFL